MASQYSWHFSNYKWVWISFLKFKKHFHVLVFFGLFIQGFSHSFFYQVFTLFFLPQFLRGIYLLVILHPFSICCTYFLPVYGCLLTLFIVFEHAKIIYCSDISIFSFIAYVFWVGVRKPFLRLRWKNNSPRFSSGTCMVSFFFLCLGPWSIWSFILCMAWGMDLIK